MARTLSGYTDAELIGRHVYMPFKPQQPGKILSVDGRFVEVQWINGKVTKPDRLYLNDLDALIDEHRQKIATHEANINLLASM